MLGPYGDADKSTRICLEKPSLPKFAASNSTVHMSLLCHKLDGIRSNLLDCPFLSCLKMYRWNPGLRFLCASRANSDASTIRSQRHDVAAASCKLATVVVRAIDRSIDHPLILGSHPHRRSLAGVADHKRSWNANNANRHRHHTLLPDPPAAMPMRIISQGRHAYILAGYLMKRGKWSDQRTTMSRRMHSR
jgi:hypothetical protein